MTPLGHCTVSVSVHSTSHIFEKRTESREKQWWCNWLSSRTAYPWWWLKLPLPDLLPRGKRRALAFHHISHSLTSQHPTRFPKSPLSLPREAMVQLEPPVVWTHHTLGCWLPLPLPDLLHKWFLPPNLPKDILHPSACTSYTWKSHLAGRVKLK